MFYVEEDIQPIVDVVTAALGTVGNMSQERGVIKNVTVSTPEFGKVWYGDYVGSVETLERQLTNVSNTTGYTLSWES